MTELEAIVERHSVRNYKPEKIKEEHVKQIKDKIEELNKSGTLHLQFIEDAGDTYSRLLNKAMGLSSAPSVIACVGKKSNNLEERIGYYGQQLVLFAQTLGLNTCWAGTFNKKKMGAVVGEDERLVISIAIGYGTTPGKVRKSKTPDQVIISKGERPAWFEKGVEMALLAPTAINQQKFLIKLNEDGTVDFEDKGGPFSKVDIGIVKYTFEVATRDK